MDDLELSVVDQDGGWKISVDFGPVDGDGLVAGSGTRDVNLVAGPHHLTLWVQHDARRN